MKCGTYEIVITPALGLLIPGYFEKRYAEDILDELYGKAVLFSEGDKITGFMALDILHVRADMVKSIRERFTLLTGKKADGIMVCATHAHTGQAIEANDEFGYPDENWVKVTCDKCADALVLAYKRMVECKIGLAKSEEHTLAFNRRYWHRDGIVYTWPGRCNPENVKPAAGIDPEFDVIRVDTLDNKPICVITNFANHLDLIGGCKYSADYPGAMSRKLKKMLGDNVVSLFLNGFCGDVTHINYDTTDPYPADYYITIGEKMADKVLSMYQSISTDKVNGIQYSSIVRKIPRRQPTKEMYEDGKEYIAKYNAGIQNKAEANEDSEFEKPSTGDADLMALSYAKCNVNLYENPILFETPEMQVIKIGDVYFNGAPGELFADLALDFKNRSKKANNIMVNLANGCYGYIATKKAFSEGGYEVTLDRYVNMSEDTGDIMINTLLEIQDNID